MFDADSPEKTRIQTIQLSLTVAGLLLWAVTITVGLVPNWESFSLPVKWTIGALGLISFLISFIAAIGPAINAVARLRSKLSLRSFRKGFLPRLAEHVQTGQGLFKDDETAALFRYMIALRHGLYESPEVYTKLNEFVCRLRILSLWRSTLEDSTKRRLNQREFQRLTTDITAFYHELSNIVREFKQVSLPEADVVKQESEARSMVEVNYNQHVNWIERRLQKLKHKGMISKAPVYYKF